MKSLRKRLVLIMLCMVLIPIIVTNVIGYLFLTEGFQNKMEANNKNLSALISDNVSSFVEKAYSITEDVSHYKDVEDFNTEGQKYILEDTVGRNSFFDLLYVQGMDGMQTARSSGENGDRSERWWFQQIMGDKKPFVSKSYYSVNGNVPVTSIILPIYDVNQKLTGIMGADLKLNALQSLVEKYSKSQDNYVYIIDGEGVVIAHPNTKQVSEMYNYITSAKTVLVKDGSGKVKVDESGNQVTEVKEITIPDKLKEITKESINGKSGITEYKNEDGNKVISAYSTIKLPGTSKNWAVITVENKSDAMSLVTEYVKQNAFIAILLLIVAIIATYFISRSITKPIVQLMHLMEKAAGGDLTVNSSYQSKNEIGRLSASFSIMITQIRDLIIQIDSLGDQVVASSHTLSSTTQQTVASIEEVSKATTDVAMGASNQAKDAEDGVIAVTEFSEEIDNISIQINQSKDFSDQIHSSAVKGLEIMDLLTDKTEESNKVGNEVVNTVEELNKKANEINTIVEAIMQISENTNLLSLNASIEAARAGEAGKGFAVVAEEIRKLATNTSVSSNNIKNIITALQDDVKKTQDTILLSKTVNEEQTNAVTASKEAFQEISQGINGIVARTNKVIEGLNLIKTSKEKVVSVIENFSAVSEETAASSEEVSASIEEQNAVAEQVGTLANELYEISKKLEIAINTFVFK